MNGQTIWQDRRAAELRQRKRVDRAGLKIRPEEPAIRPHRCGFQRQVAKNIFSVEFRYVFAAIDETAGNGDAVVMVILQRPHRAADRIDEVRRNSRTAIAGRRADGAGGSGRTVRAIEEKISFLPRPTIIAANQNAIDLFNVVLSDVGVDQIAGDAIESKAIRIAQTVSVNFMDLARSLERIARGDSILPVGTYLVRNCRE